MEGLPLSKENGGEVDGDGGEGKLGWGKGLVGEAGGEMSLGWKKINNKKFLSSVKSNCTATFLSLCEANGMATCGGRGR